MRFASDCGGDHLIDAWEEQPPDRGKCLRCDGDVVLRGGSLGLASILTAGSMSHYAHCGKACGYSKRDDKSLEKLILQMSEKTNADS